MGEGTGDVWAAKSDRGSAETIEEKQQQRRIVDLRISDQSWPGLIRSRRKWPNFTSEGSSIHRYGAGPGRVSREEKVLGHFCMSCKVVGSELVGNVIGLREMPVR